MNKILILCVGLFVSWYVGVDVDSSAYFKTQFCAFFSPLTQLQLFYYKLLQLLKGNFPEKAVAFK